MSDFYNKYPYTDFHELNLDWIIERVKQLTEDWLETKQAWENTEADWQELYNYVHDYFDNLDVQEEINNKINAMIADGTFVTITTPVIEAKVASMMPGTVASQIGDTVASQIGATVASQIGATVASQIDDAVVSPVNTWLTQHITQPTTPVVDTSLSISGAAADAAVVGADFAKINDDLINFYSKSMSLDGLSTEFVPTLTIGSAFVISTETFTPGYGSSYGTTGMIKLPPEVYKVKMLGNSYIIEESLVARFAYFDDNQNFISYDQNAISDVPSNAKYIGITNYYTDPTDISIVYYRYNILNSMIQNSEVSTNLLSVPDYIHPAFTSGYWLNNGVPVHNHNDDLAITDFIPIYYGTYGITTNLGITNIPGATSIAFYDDKKEYISGVNTKNADVIPTGSSFFRLSNYSLTPHADAVYKLLTLKRIGTIEASVANNAPDWTSKKWCVIGDSITEDNFRANEHYWSYIEDLTNITIENKGISGTGYKIFHPFYERIEDASFPEDCNIITMFGGVNDLVGWGGNTLTIGLYNDSSTTTICGCINKAIDDLESKYNVYLPLGIISPLPCSIDTSLPAFSDAIYPNQYPLLTNCRMETFVEELKKLCAYRGYPFLDLFHESGLTPWVSAAKEALFKPPAGYGSADGLHPNAEGHAKIYRKILKFISTIII